MKKTIFVEDSNTFIVPSTYGVIQRGEVISSLKEHIREIKKNGKIAIALIIPIFMVMPIDYCILAMPIALFYSSKNFIRRVAASQKALSCIKSEFAARKDIEAVYQFKLSIRP